MRLTGDAHWLLGTIGVGGMGAFGAGVLEIGPEVGYWVYAGLCAAPFFILILFRRGAAPGALVDVAHTIGVLWYLALAAAATLAIASRGFEIYDLLYFALVGLGATPCIQVMRETTWRRG